MGEGGRGKTPAGCGQSLHPPVTEWLGRVLVLVPTLNPPAWGASLLPTTELVSQGRPTRKAPVSVRADLPRLPSSRARCPRWLDTALGWAWCLGSGFSWWNSWALASCPNICRVCEGDLLLRRLRDEGQVPQPGGPIFCDPDVTALRLPSCSPPSRPCISCNGHVSIPGSYAVSSCSSVFARTVPHAPMPFSTLSVKIPPSLQGPPHTPSAQFPVAPLPVLTGSGHPHCSLLHTTPVCACPPALGLRFLRADTWWILTLHPASANQSSIGAWDLFKP